MKKIRVTLGGCGIAYTDEHGVARHALKTAESGPFECDDEQADRLVRLGVAAYVNAPAQTAPAAPANDPKEPGQQSEGQNATMVTGHLDAEQLATMTIKQLEELAGELGVDVSGCKKKADYIDAIVAVEVEAPVEDDELPPDLGVADPE